MVMIFGSSIYYFTKIKKGTPVSELIIENKKSEKKHPRCLNENERADFKIERLGKYPSVEYNKGFIEIIVREINTNEEIIRFKIDDIISPSHYHPVETHRCGVYVIRRFNYDPGKTKQDPGYREELWKYEYNGNGQRLILLAEKQKEFISYYSPDFRIDPHEIYLVLEKGYLGREDYSIVIKNLKTKEDVFTLSAKSIAEQHPNIIGVFNMLEWSKDSRYFWASISDGAYVKGYLRIDIKHPKVDIFEVPDGALGGMPLNINTGYIPIQPGLVWTGDTELTQEIKEKERKEGKKSFLYLYNLFTKEKKLIQTTDEPQFFFKPKWISDTELEYYLPTGERKVYKINE
jgi:protease II